MYKPNLQACSCYNKTGFYHKSSCLTITTHWTLQLICLLFGEGRGRCPALLTPNVPCVPQASRCDSDSLKNDLF